MARPISKQTYDRIEILKKYGYDTSDYELWRKKWCSLCSIAKCQRGVYCDLTFEAYVILANSAEIKDVRQIGKSTDSYQMGRIGDTGPYTLGNCRFITQRQNLDERALNGGDDRGAEKRLGQSTTAGDTMRGRTKDTHEGYRKVSEFMSKAFVLTSPEGIIHRGVNLSEFCKQHGIRKEGLTAAVNGRRTQYKGWTGYYEN